MIRKSLHVVLLLLLVLSYTIVITSAAPVRLKPEPNVASQPRQRTAESLHTPSLILSAPRMAITQPLRMQDLTPDELFKALIVLRTQPKPRDPPVSPSKANTFKLPEFLDYPLFTTRDYLVQFDSHRSPVALPTNPSDLLESIHSYVFNKFYLKLKENHDANKPTPIQLNKPNAEASMDWFDAIKPRIKHVTISHVAKEGAAAEIRAREWADMIRAEHPNLLPKKETEDALKEIKRLWQTGMYKATGGSFIRFDEIASKIHR